MNRKALWLIALTIWFLSAGCNRNQGQQSTPGRQTAFDRIAASKTIRCGYVPYPPGLMIDPNTNKVSGIFVDIMEASAKSLGLKVEWTEEVGWATMIEGLNRDRYDMVCSPVWASSARAKAASFGPPIYFSGIGIYVRKGDHRFLGAIGKIDRPEVKIATIDGEMSSVLAASDFPHAQTEALPQLTDNSQMLLNVSSGRADVTFVEPYIANLFLKSHPGTLENILQIDKPYRFFSTTIMYRNDEPQLKNMMDIAINEQVNAGKVAEALRKYNIPDGSLLLPALPYRSN